MKSYYRLMLGQKSVHASDCRTGGFIGADFGIDQDLTKKLPDEWRTFNKEFIPVYLAKNPQKTKIGAGLSCGFLWSVAKKLKIGDIVLCPDGAGRYLIGQVAGDYQYAPGQILPHRRAVQWLNHTIGRAAMSEALRNSTGSIGTICEITKYADEIEALLGGACVPTIVANDPTIEDPSEFAMEKHLEDFLAENWEQTELGKEYDIYEEDGEPVGQQYQTDTGPLDLLAISKNKRKLLVVELKNGRASDSVVGQVLRYMGYVQEELAEDDQTVHGIIIAQEDDPKLRRAISMVPTIKFYRYQVSFKLIKA
jgi:restriction system protein